MAYQRPSITITEYRDSEGRVIPYGHRWDDGNPDSPPEWAYSQRGHDERFDVVVEVGQALIKYLAAHYEVTVTGDESQATLTPGHPDQAPISIKADFDSHGVVLKAGFSMESYFPDCGCQACDDDVLDLIESLEDQTFGVVNGGLVEDLAGGFIGWEINYPSGSYSSRSKADRATRNAVKAQFKKHQGRWKLQHRRSWQPWTARIDDSA